MERSKTPVRYVFTVEGTGEFPKDMLRYDNAQPFTPEDAAIVAAEYGDGGDLLFGADNHLRRNRVRLVTTDRRVAMRPSIERWESFMWKVVDYPTRVVTP